MATKGYMSTTKDGGFRIWVENKATGYTNWSNEVYLDERCGQSIGQIVIGGDYETTAYVDALNLPHLRRALAAIAKKLRAEGNAAKVPGMEGEEE
jgi:hypothetical protein